MGKIKLLLVEDDKRLASVLKKGLEEKGMEVEVAYDGTMGMRLFENKAFDILIVDLILPGMNGLELCKSIRRTKASTPIIMLTALGTTDDKLEGFDAGADDYLVKPFDIRELFARIKSLLKRADYSGDLNGDNVILEFEDIRIDTQVKKVYRAEQEVKLTPKEYKLLEYLVRNAEKVLSREEIAREVWGMDFDTGTNFIDVYINYLRKKIDKTFEPKLIHTRPGMGFILTKEL
ncbi:response regulator transcription factor [Litoribacter ruber]|uniref:Response regulator transcription factor n=1 Tax=Litoribacter ruber TaxID=702568 RepID=A0AAP2CIF6_9BACT|nr:MULTISPECIES: response regulator transcription factor [Litoribacter]MBS9525328.1 response regulator transcription factor [Litoribacter alkaliphilus]MBT0809716.1 response regulator transcription factor [Litoribacter ruber]